MGVARRGEVGYLDHLLIRYLNKVPHTHIWIGAFLGRLDLYSFRRQRLN